uniref:Rho-GAP domain-containing protein n=1 Tax=Globodera rostochiensis TaxID=31243 RepID=A0A914HX61_GLORO
MLILPPLWVRIVLLHSLQLFLNYSASNGFLIFRTLQNSPQALCKCSTAASCPQAKCPPDIKRCPLAKCPTEMANGKIVWPIKFKHAEDGGGERTAKGRQMADESDLEEFAQFFKFGDQSNVILKNIRQIKHRKTPSGTSVIVSDEAEPKKRLKHIGVGEAKEAFTAMEQIEPKCNSLVLRKLMIDNINDPMDSKRAINLATEHHFGGDVDVICSRAHFSYIYTSFLFCEVTNGFVACVAHRQSK